MQAAAMSNLKPVSLELGGKSPLIIFDDAEVDKVADLALLGVLFNKAKQFLFPFLYFHIWNELTNFTAQNQTRNDLNCF